MIRTRFAPSPTGYLHIGGVRTALFNWLFSRQQGGSFILRIDDTDRQRNVEEALQPILNGFRWLGIDWDEGPEVGGDYGPYFQSERQDLYQAAVEELLKKRLAYFDYATSEELQVERETAQEAKERFVYSRRWMAEDSSTRSRWEAEGRQPVVRLKMPRGDSCCFTDLIRGEMEFEWSREQDHVIQRADGTFLYHLASVVDDHKMEISHVVRAEEHLSNTPRQIFIAQSLGYTLPEYAHLPYVAEPGSKTKLSKRKLQKYLKNPDFAQLNLHGQRIADAVGFSVDAEAFNPVIVDFYEKTGFLPEALVNYLLLLGWSLDDKTEVFSREEMIANFGLERVNRAPASFDPAKLMAVQESYMEKAPLNRKLSMTKAFLHQALGAENVREVDHSLGQILAAAGDRIKVAGDILDYRDFFTTDTAVEYDEKAFEKRLRKPPEAASLLEEFSERLAAAEPFEAAPLENLLRAFVEEKDIKIGDVIHALRVAVTGKAVGFGMFDILAILGKERVVARIERALTLI
jgi:glutamyl-tRNA synthetase